MRSQNFGIEIEMTGLTRSAAARIIAGYFGTQATHVGGTYDAYTIRDEENQQWKVVRDTSIRCRDSRNREASRDYAVEFVSPICKYEDIGTIQELVRKLRAGGARVNDSCGIHVHVDASAHTPQTLRNIVNIMAAKEDLLYKALQVKVNRENYCRKADTRFLEELNHKRPKTMDKVEELWYNGYGSRYSYTRLLSDREIQKLRRRIPDDFSEAVAASLTVGCLRLHAVLYRSRDTLLLGYDVFVKDDPDAPEWIYYDSLPDTAGLQETQMLRVLDGMAQAQGLSYTECCFGRLNGKLPQKPACAP